MAFLISTIILLLLGAVRLPDIGYSTSLAHRLQVEAFLDGRLELAKDPAALEFDYAYVNGKVQQVWGLGVPLWRTLFEWPWRALFGSIAPDRLPLLVAQALLLFVGLTVFLRETHGGTGEELVRGQAVASAFGLAFSPFLINLYHTRFLVYEETLIYTFLVAMLLFLLTGGLLARENRRLPVGRLVLISLLAGFGAFVRPTLLFYGLATMGSIWFLCRKQLSPASYVASGIAFVTPLAVLAWANWIRFGDPLEFGHHLNLTMPSVVYVTRLNNPFASASFLERTTELFGALFFLSRFNGCDYFAKHWFPGQADALRWREFNESTFSPVSLGLLVLFAIGGAVAVTRTNKKPHSVTWLRDSPIQRVALLWAGIAFLGLGVFYLYTPVLTARYAHDFAGVVTVCCVMAIRLLCRNNMLFICAILAWSGYALTSFRTSAQTPSLASAAQATQYVRDWENRQISHPIPAEYHVGMTNLPAFAGACEGWNHQTGEVGISCTFFLPPCKTLQLQVEATGDDDLATVRVSSDGNRWRRVDERREDASIWYEFENPTPGPVHASCFPLFLSLWNDEDILRNESPRGRLLRVIAR